MTRTPGVAALGVILTVCAAGFDSRSLYVSGLALLLLVAGSHVWVALAARATRVVRTACAPSVEEGCAYRIGVSLETSRLGSRAGELCDGELTVSGATGRVEQLIRFERRGRQPLEPASLTIRDPLGLAERRVYSARGEVLVLPRVEPIGALSMVSALTGGAKRSSARQAELELDSLRPYQPGTAASRIHWPTVARSGVMMERRLVAGADRGPLVVVDPRRALTEEALDCAVRAAASLCVALARSGGCAVLLPGDRRATTIHSDLRSWGPLHARLALLEALESSPVPARVELGGPVFWVSASVSLPTGLRHVVSPQRVLITPEPLPGSPVAFSVAGCCAHLLGGVARRAA